MNRWLEADRDSHQAQVRACTPPRPRRGPVAFPIDLVTRRLPDRDIHRVLTVSGARSVPELSKQMRLASSEVKNALARLSKINAVVFHGYERDGNRRRAVWAAKAA